MDTNVPYMPSVKNLSKILASIQKAAVPDAFGIDFLKDLGYSSSNDRSVIKLLKYLGMLDSSGKPQSSYREFVDSGKSRFILAKRIKTSYDDLYTSHKEAHTKSIEELKGWFKTKTGVGEAVAYKMATTFKTLSQYADFSKSVEDESKVDSHKGKEIQDKKDADTDKFRKINEASLGLVYRLEIHLPDTQNIETYRAIFKALREELMP